MLFSPDEDAYEAMSDESNYSDSDQSQQSSDSDEIETKEHIGSLKCKHDGSKSWSRLQQRLTIVIVYIGLLYKKEPITLADLVRFVKLTRSCLKKNVVSFVWLMRKNCIAWFPYDRKESQGIAASRNKSGKVCLRLSALIWKPAKTLLGTPCDRCRRQSQR